MEGMGEAAHSRTKKKMWMVRKQKMDVKKVVRNFLYTYGLLMGTGSTLLILLTFINAYTHPAMTTTITINTYNEAHLEAILIPVTLLCSIYSSITTMKRRSTKNV